MGCATLTDGMRWGGGIMGMVGSVGIGESVGMGMCSVLAAGVR